MLSSLLLAIAVGRTPVTAPKTAAASIRRFDRNAGQWPGDVRFVARTPHGTLMLGSADARLQLRDTDGRSTAIGLRWEATARAIEGVDRLPGVSNYLIGSDRARWKAGVGGFRRVRYAEVAPHVDLEFYGATDGFEYDLVVRPGGNPNAVALRLDGVSSAKVAQDGSIVLETSAGTFRQHVPIAFQERDGVRTPVEVRYELEGDRLRFVASRYDRTRPLIIDPTIDFSTYLGGENYDFTTAVATDAAGNIYVAGRTDSPDFPLAPRALLRDHPDAYVAKLAPDGSSLLYVTFVGGQFVDEPTGIAAGADGSVYLGGWTSSDDFPCVNALQSTRSNGASGFVAHLAADGSTFAFSTYLASATSMYLGNFNTTLVRGLAINPAGDVYVTGTTRGPGFPLKNALRTAPGGSFVTRLTSAGSLVYSTYFGDAGTGYPTQSVTLYGIAVDASGAAYVGGDTLAAALPATPGAYRTMPGDGLCPSDSDYVFTPIPCTDGVVAKLAPSGALVYATYLRGDNELSTKRPSESVRGIGVDAQGNAVVVGNTTSDVFPTTPGATRSVCESPCESSRVFVTRLNASGSGLVSSALLGGPGGGTASVGTSYFGGGATNVAVDALGQAIVTGSTFAPDMPMIGAQQPVMASGFLFSLTSNGSAATSLTGPPGAIMESMAIAADGTQYAATSPFWGWAKSPRLYRSRDGGHTWTRLSGMIDAGDVSIDPNDSNTIYTPRDKSTDAGATWTSLGATLIKAPQVRPGSSNVLFGLRLVSSDSSVGALVKSVNGGITWTDASSGIPPGTVFWGIAIAPSNPSVVYAWFDTLYVSTDAGASWQQAALPSFSISQLAIDPALPGTAYATSISISKTVDFGAHWTKLLDSAYSAIAVPSPGLILATATVFPGVTGIYRSTDAGASWTLIDPIRAAKFVLNPPAPEAVLMIADPQPDVFVAALSPTGGLVYESYLGGLGYEWPGRAATTPDGGVVVTGTVSGSARFPIVNAVQPTPGPGIYNTDGFVTKLRYPQTVVNVDTPVDHGTAFVPFTLGGWAIDRGSANDDGIDGMQVWAISAAGVPIFIGAPAPDVPRPDVAAAYGSRFANVGFNVTVGTLAPGTYTFAIYPHSTVSNEFAVPRLMTITVAQGGLAAIGPPAPGGTTYGGANLAGWAIDRAATAGTGISAVHVWAYPNPGSGQPPIFLGVASYGAARPDVGAIYGSQFTNSGFNLTLPPLAPGPYLFVASPFSSVTNSFQAPATVMAAAGPGLPAGSIDIPANNSTVGGTFALGGWAIDRSAPAGTGIDYVHVYAFKNGAPTFLGAATIGVSRGDIAAIFGSQFTNAGYSLAVTGLAPGTYDIYTFAHSTVTGANFVRANRITVQ